MLKHMSKMCPKICSKKALGMLKHMFQICQKTYLRSYFSKLDLRHMLQRMFKLWRNDFHMKTLAFTRVLPNASINVPLCDWWCYDMWMICWKDVPLPNPLVVETLSIALESRRSIHSRGPDRSVWKNIVPKQPPGVVTNGQFDDIVSKAGQTKITCFHLHDFHLPSAIKQKRQEWNNR